MFFLDEEGCSECPFLVKYHVVNTLLMKWVVVDAHFR